VRLSLLLACPVSHSSCERTVPAPIKHDAFLAAIKGEYKVLSYSDKERLFHSHGQPLLPLLHGSQS
jgi:hypothetical protein